MRKSHNSLHLKLVLRYVRPLTWREVAIPGDATLAQLHQVIQQAFDWDDYHLHEFEMGKRGLRFTSAEEIKASKDFWGSEDNSLDEKKFSVFEVLFTPDGTPVKSPKFIYTYDFGDDWEVEVIPKGFYAETVKKGTWALVKMKGLDDPPEDCGGPYGFMELLAMRANLAECTDDDIEKLEWYYPDEDFKAKAKAAKKAKKAEQDVTQKAQGTGKK